MKQAKATHKESKQKKSIRLDLLVIGGLLLVGGIFGLVLFLTSKPGKAVEIRATGEKTVIVPLDEDGRYEIQGVNGVNVLVVKDGKAHMDEASCPDGICMAMGEIDTVNRSIVCLPNEIVVSVIETGRTWGSIKSTTTDSDEPDVIAGGKQ